MAIAVIGGVTLSTLLTLFVVPCAYSLFAKIERKQYGLAGVDPLELLPRTSVVPKSPTHPA